MVYLAFYKGKGNFINKLVRFFTRSRYSHCVVVVQNTKVNLSVDDAFEYVDVTSVQYSSTSSKGGVYALRSERRYMYEDFANDVIDNSTKDWDIALIDKLETTISDADVIDFYNRTKNCKYDYLGAIGSVFAIFKQKKSRYFCSEWCAECLKLSKPYKYTPDSLYRYITSL